MDELELLKQNWNSQDRELPKLTYGDIYKMLLKKSSSIVKWILFISIGEIIFWTLLSLLVPDSSKKFTYELGLKQILFTANMLYYAVFICFIIIFYRNYRKISTTDSIKDLMGNILRTRRTVKYFIIYNILGTSIMFLGINIFYFTNQDLVFDLMVKNYGVLSTMDKHQFFTVFFWTQAIIAIVVILLIILFYRLIYGILLRRLKRNYEELKKIES